MNSLIKKLKINSEESALHALFILDSSDPKQRLVLVVDRLDKLVGTINDSDIRRGLLRGLSLDSSVSGFMNRKYLSIKEGQRPDLISKKAKENNIMMVPVLDREQRIVNIHYVTDYISFKQNNHPILIMAGGKGTRLYPYTKNCPKPMIQVNGKPMLEIIIDQYIESGFSNFYISVNYLKEQIMDYFGDGSERNISITYLEESIPLGTAGSIGLMKGQIEQDLVITNGDVLTHFNPDKLLQFHIDNTASATVGARFMQTNLQYGVIEVSNMKLQTFKEKPVLHHLINAGVYVINPQIVELIQPNEYLDMPDLLLRAKGLGLDVFVCPIHEEWIDVGRPESLEKAENLLSIEKKD